VELDRKFQTIVLDNLGTASRKAIADGLEPSKMDPSSVKRVRTEVLNLVYGKKATFLK
jgi:hypothetical protein